MARKSDHFPLVLGGGILALLWLFHTIWSILVEDWVKHQLEQRVGHTVAEMIERFGAVGFPALAAGGIVWFLYHYIERSLRAEVGLGVVIEDEPVAPIPIDEASLGAYMWANQFVRRLDQRIASESGATLDAASTIALPMVEQAQVLGIPNVAILDRLLRHYEEETIKMSHYSMVSNKVTKGECIWYLLNFLSAQLGREKYQEFHHLLRYTSGTGEGAMKGYEQITSYALKPQKQITWWKHAPDFNLVSMADAIEIARTQLSATPYGAALEKNSTPGQPISPYYYSIGVTRYGREIQYDPRRTQEKYRRPIGAAPFKAVLDGDTIKLMPQIDPRSTDIQRPRWDRIYILKPKLLEAIERIKKRAT
jgi:hypothetical protein